MGDHPVVGSSMLPRALKDHFATAIYRMLRPVVRHLIAQGITHPMLASMVLHSLGGR